MSAFFGNVMVALRVSISATTLSAASNATTSSLSIGVSGGRGTYTYSWVSSGTGCTITSPTASATTFTGSSVTGTTSVYCAIRDTITGNTLNTDTCAITWTANAPGIPPIGSVSAADKSFTINWTAPTNDGGSPITGYYVQNSTNGGTSWSTPILVGVSTSYTWSGNTIVYNGNTYIGRVAAVNAIGTGSYSGNSAGAVPTFAAPTINNVFGSSGYPSTASPGLRPFNITFTPTACVNYASTYIYIQYVTFESFGGYYASVNGALNNLYTTTTGQQTTGNINSVYAQNITLGGFWYDSNPSQAFYVYAITYNNDGYGVASAINTGFTTSAYTYGLPSGPFLTTSYSAATGTIVVTGNSFSQTPTYSIPNNTTQITSLTIEAWVTITGINICSNGRNFTVWFSGSSTTIPNPTGVSNNCNSVPFTNNSGTTRQFKPWNVADTGYQVQGAGRLRINGGGTIGTWATNPDNRIRVIININGTELLLY